ncbi:MAG: hypothetical protein HPZ91_02535 [Lentisphaeria bacterium]|nr:hypothetical protein [Lentisphaeria bacterium]
MKYPRYLIFGREDRSYSLFEIAGLIAEGRLGVMNRVRTGEGPWEPLGKTVFRTIFPVLYMRSCRMSEAIRRNYRNFTLLLNILFGVAFVSIVLQLAGAAALSALLLLPFLIAALLALIFGSMLLYDFWNLVPRVRNRIPPLPRILLFYIPWLGAMWNFNLFYKLAGDLEDTLFESGLPQGPSCRIISFLACLALLVAVLFGWMLPGTVITLLLMAYLTLTVMAIRVMTGQSLELLDCRMKQCGELTVPAETPPAEFRRILKPRASGCLILALIFAVLMLFGVPAGIIGAAFAVKSYLTADLDAARESLERRRLPLGAEAFNRRWPEPENPADFHRYRETASPIVLPDRVNPEAGLPKTQEELALWQRAVSDNKPALAFLAAESAAPPVGFSRPDFTGEAETGDSPLPYTGLPETGKFSRLILAEAGIHCAEGDFSGALSSLRLLSFLRDQLLIGNQYPLVTDALEFERMRLHFLDRNVDLGKLSSNELRSLMAECGEAGKRLPPVFEGALHFELRRLHSLLKGKELLLGFFLRSAAARLNGVMNCLDMTGREPAFTGWTTRVSDPEEMPGTPVFGENPRLAHFLLWRVVAAERMLTEKAALELFRRDHGKLPGKPEELVPRYLDTLPQNPFTGQPFVYHEGKLHTNTDLFRRASGQTPRE